VVDQSTNRGAPDRLGVVRCEQRSDSRIAAEDCGPIQQARPVPPADAEVGCDVPNRGEFLTTIWICINGLRARACTPFFLRCAIGPIFGREWHDLRMKRLGQKDSLCSRCRMSLHRQNTAACCGGVQVTRLLVISVIRLIRDAD
jgi:hypothetical protein